MHIILGSQSPRRKEILSFFKLPFTVCSSDFDEDSIPFGDCPKTYTQRLAEEKALALKNTNKDSLIITADTTVCLNKKIFGKPIDEEEAFLFLKELSGNIHQVYTSIAILYQEKLLVDTEMTLVTFCPMSDNQIKQYIKATNPLDKAGAYAIQGLGSLIVSRIEGCYYNVMGLPIRSLCTLLKKVGIDLWDYIGP